MKMIITTVCFYVVIITNFIIIKCDKTIKIE